ncbi:5-formyltetrahydrofolate cyclo-ligase, partial [Streptomyces hundungensis]|uniref:5-formyltetrahydrofolate cyclo-ligase n=1 Tax=Streptomyces hundungensis TaxID=1077946 RepID=UPI0033EFA872
YNVLSGRTRGLPRNWSDFEHLHRASVHKPTRPPRGGGSYDRVLARIQASGADPFLVVLLYANEVVARVPEEPHDHPVKAVVTPYGVTRFAV